jgi:hypothetical protein
MVSVFPSSERASLQYKTGNERQLVALSVAGMQGASGTGCQLEPFNLRN